MSDLEKLLVKKSQTGDIESFELLISSYDKKAYNIAYRVMGNEEDAKDMAQEALLRVFRSIKDFKGQSSFSTWLYRIVTNVCLDELRRRKNDKHISIDSTVQTENGEMHMELCSDKETPESVYERVEQRELIKKAIQELNDEYRSVIVLRDIQGFSYDEISTMLECSLGTVKSRINRARSMLREKLKTSMELSRGNRV
ncbi:MAG TPA: sigma-70 family RNA polymerase sigma factor [Negativicutes bacterium]|nr:sigma-70 family RNA polymerase sigma factor [Negativicutes bacterium]